jgi:hypothetical protein
VIIFARTRYEYPSYGDFFRFVEISGFKTCFVDQIDLAQDNTYIFTPMNGEVAPHLRNFAGTRRAKVIWWNLERPHDETLPSSMDTLEGLIDSVWVSDRYFATLNPRFTFVRLAGHQHYGMRTAARHWDVCHLSYLWGRRLEAVDRLRAQGVSIAPEAWGAKEQNAIVATSHMMLTLHQYEVYPIIEPIRFAIAASYGIPIVSESFLDDQARDLAFVLRSIDQIDQDVIEWLKHKDRLADEGEKLHRKLCIDTDFRWEVVKALA